MPAPLTITSLRAKFTPASISAYERRPLWRLTPGDRVLWVSVHKLTLADSGTLSTITLGDWDDPDGFVTAGKVHDQSPNPEIDPNAENEGDLDLEAPTAGDHVDGTGTYLRTANGKLWLTNEQVFATYDPGQSAADYGSTLPVVEFHMAIVKGAGLL